MEFEKFCAEVKRRLKNTLLNDYGIIVRKVTKNNGVILTAISISENNMNIAPTIYLDGLYLQYKSGEITMDEVVDTVCNLATEKTEEAKVIRETVRKLESFDNVKDDIVIKVVNYDMNKEQLKNYPYIKWNDLAITYHYRMKANNNYGNLDLGVGGNMNISNVLLEMWNISKEELHSIAFENTKRLCFPRIIPLSSIMLEMISDLFTETKSKEIKEDVENESMYVFNNGDRLFGASSFLFPDLIKEKNEKDWHCETVYILPSSVHELILVPDRNDYPVERLREIVKEVNGEIEPIEILSDSIYKWERKTNEISIV